MVVQRLPLTGGEGPLALSPAGWIDSLQDKSENAPAVLVAADAEQHELKFFQLTQDVLEIPAHANGLLMRCIFPVCPRRVLQRVRMLLHGRLTWEINNLALPSRNEPRQAFHLNLRPTLARRGEGTLLAKRLVVTDCSPAMHQHERFPRIQRRWREFTIRTKWQHSSRFLENVCDSWKHTRPVLEHGTMKLVEFSTRSGASPWPASASNRQADTPRSDSAQTPCFKQN